jgi:hypothetical protein
VAKPDAVGAAAGRETDVAAKAAAGELVHDASPVEFPHREWVPDSFWKLKLALIQSKENIMVIHILTSQGEQMVVQVVDGNVILPAAPQAGRAVDFDMADAANGVMEAEACAA